MALFGRKKKKAELAEEEQQLVTAEAEAEAEAEEEEEEEADVTDAAEETAEDEAAAEKTELSVDEQFKKDCANISRCLRLMFPQQMLIGFYYAELQSGGYIDDFCCYALDGRLIERQQIPSLCGMSLPDMVSREEKLEQAFFDFRKSAEAASGKPCNAVSIMMLNDGQVKLDVTAAELVDGEEEIRYGKWRERVEMANPRYMPPKISQEQMQEIQNESAELYKALGTEFFSFLPDTQFKKAYFYAENGENGVFYFHRLVTNDDEFIDGDELFDKFEMNKEEAAANRVEIVKLIMQLREIFIRHKQKPFTTVTLSVTDKGEFQSHLGFGPTDAAGEQKRLEDWKNTFKG
ncbi:MAG: immunity protein YezG family protein [Oscillospiraceae bacterium]